MSKPIRPRYLLTTASLVPYDARTKEIDAYRRRHRGIGFDEVFNIRLALAVFLLPRLRLRVNEMRNVSEKKTRRDGKTTELLPSGKDDAIRGLYKILDGKHLEEYEARALQELVGALLRE